MKLNKVLIAGNLTRDVEVRQLPNSNTSIANIGLAISRKFKTGQGETKEETLFVDCEAWGKTAETIAQYFNKGKPIFIEGRLKLEQWQDKDGGNRSKIKVVVESFQFVESGGKSNEGPSKPRPSSRGTSGPQPVFEPVDEDSIPF